MVLFAKKTENVYYKVIGVNFLRDPKRQFNYWFVTLFENFVDFSKLILDFFTQQLESEKLHCFVKQSLFI